MNENNYENTEQQESIFLDNITAYLEKNEGY